MESPLYYKEKGVCTPFSRDGDLEFCNIARAIVGILHAIGWIMCGRLEYVRWGGWGGWMDGCKVGA